MPETAFIFDMDGVIIDSNPVHRLAWLEYNGRHGIATDEAMQLRMYGKRNDEIVRDFFGEQLTDEEVFAHGAGKEQLYREMIAPAVAQLLVAGVREFLAKHQDIPTGLATNAEAANVEFVLRPAGIAHLFRAVVDGSQVRNAKPHPDIYLRAAELLGVAPARCVVFEDSFAGVEAGLAAGMCVVGIRTSHGELPGVAYAADNFLDPGLEDWLAQRILASRMVH